MTMKGMNVADAERAVVVFKASAGEVTDVLTQCTQAMQFEWFGEDAVRTQDSWANEYSKMLQNVAEALTNFAGTIDQNRQEQVGVST